MKKVLISVLAIAFVLAMSLSVVSAALPPPPYNTWGPGGDHKVGLTPGFWKHNLSVYLHLTNGAYSDTGINGKINDAWMVWSLNAIALYPTKPADDGSNYITAQQLANLANQLLADLSANGPGSVTSRTNAANWFNFVNGYLPFQ